MWEMFSPSHLLSTAQQGDLSETVISIVPIIKAATPHSPRHPEPQSGEMIKRKRAINGEINWLVSWLLSISTSTQWGLVQRNIIRNQTVMNELMEREPLETVKGERERRREMWWKREGAKKKNTRFFHACKLHYGARLSLMSYTAHDNCRVG